MTSKQLDKTRIEATSRTLPKFDYPLDPSGIPDQIPNFYGKLIFDINKSDKLTQSTKEKLLEISKSHKSIPKKLAKEVADAVLLWATRRGATHFCHWFQPLTGFTAEKHDGFISIKNGKPFIEFGAQQLMQGEPDASSFPNGGSRSTFEARGYTSWDLSSPLFLQDGPNGRTLCIPTGFISYTGDALDIKTPLLRSDRKLSIAATKYLNAAGLNDVTNVESTCGAEQEYFLIDKDFYNSRTDLVMTGRTLIGASTPKSQQLDDHYFGDISNRVLAFMQELDIKLYELGIPSKTRHNEVAPGQFELAPIFENSNIASDHNQLIMNTIKNLAKKHNFVALFHEKPFANINGSGKHLNWSMRTNTGLNLLNPGKNPSENTLFITTLSCVLEAINRHGDIIRASIASAGNDHRLGANEAPPSIISAYVGDTLNKIIESIINKEKFKDDLNQSFESTASQLATLSRDNTDRNRTSPFAFTGNRFELRACGSNAAIGFPLSILNAAITSIFNEASEKLLLKQKNGISVTDSLKELSYEYFKSSHKVIFNEDGYSSDWLTLAKERGLSNFKDTPSCLHLFQDKKATNFLTESGIYSQNEINTRYNVLVEQYVTYRTIEIKSLISMVQKNVIPDLISYKDTLINVIEKQNKNELDCHVEREIYKNVNYSLDKVYSQINYLSDELNNLKGDELVIAKRIAKKLLPVMEEIKVHCDKLENICPSSIWSLPTYSDMLFLL